MRVLLAGCGDLGTRLGLRLVRSGHEVIGARRHPGQLPDSFETLAVDLNNPGDTTIDDIDSVVITLTPDDYSDAGYEQTYRRGVEGLISILRSRPKRVILVSSTRVLGSASPGETANEDTVPRPGSGPARTLWETEQLIRSTFASASIVRAAGIYGREGSRLVDGVLSGRAVNYRRWTNRVHHRDLIRGLEALLFAPDPPQLLHAADSCPVQLGEVVEYLASALNVSPPPDLRAEPEAGRRIENTRFHDFLGSLDFPTFRDGYSHQLHGPEPAGLN
ncbi:SDR family oxidoreductase [Brevibacterium sandarakinum]|uniref:SDR family oxidoreductase n=1 Tax=Brevibacterium sandarakinum TaxID=629680 RepID=UPI002655B0AF|nr:SDR family oxidoreductase [Brevibacterium sandarakinum]MDN5657622.1 SDR family oxidoreductase [Brevibacterium sandarakinum]